MNSNPLPALAAAPAAGSAWLRLRRSAVYMVLLCTAIALLLSVMDRGGLVGKLIYSFAIGGSCWAIIDSGRYGAAHLLNRLRRARGQAPLPHPGFPGWGWMAVVMLVGMALGPLAGTAIGDYATGHNSPSLLQFGAPGARLTLMVTVLASLLTVFTLSTLERLASARAQAEIAQRSAAEHRLKLLESQLEPHMLFNTLANLRVLIALDPPRAQEMLDRLIGYLRATLGASRAALHPLRDEFARLHDYLALMQVRMGARLAVSQMLPDDLADVPVPPLLLQPLVENSIHHGLEPKIGGGRIELAARREGERLVLEVRDTGVGVGATTTARPAGDSAAASSGFGLQQVRERLAALYGAAAGFELTAVEDAEGGMRAVVQIPLSRPDA